jgi:hypothetical protein
VITRPENSAFEPPTKEGAEIASHLMKSSLSKLLFIFFLLAAALNRCKAEDACADEENKFPELISHDMRVKQNALAEHFQEFSRPCEDAIEEFSHWKSGVPGSCLPDVFDYKSSHPVVDGTHIVYKNSDCLRDWKIVREIRREHASGGPYRRISISVAFLQTGIDCLWIIDRNIDPRIISKMTYWYSKDREPSIRETAQGFEEAAKWLPLKEDAKTVQYAEREIEAAASAVLKTANSLIGNQEWPTLRSSDIAELRHRLDVAFPEDYTYTYQSIKRSVASIKQWLGNQST